MTVKQVYEKLSQLIDEGFGDSELVLASTESDADGSPVVDLFWIESPTDVSGFNMPYADWPICMWASEKRRYDMTGDEAKEL